MDFFTIFVSLQNIKRSFHESLKWYFAGANWWFGIKTDQIWQSKQSKEITFDAKSSIGPIEISLSRLMKWTLDVSKRNKNCGTSFLLQLILFPDHSHSGARICGQWGSAWNHHQQASSYSALVVCHFALPQDNCSIKRMDVFMQSLGPQLLYGWIWRAPLNSKIWKLINLIFVSLRNIKRSFHESWKWYFAWAIWWFGIKSDQLSYHKCQKGSRFTLKCVN